ncbi:MAG: PAS domain S-box protein [Spirochaetia bacterium]|nr:PAS domain S-box protein [Spirochaetia bacterium]
MDSEKIEQPQEFIREAARSLSRCSHRSIDYLEIAELFRVLSGARFVALNEVSDYGEHTTTRAIAGVKETLQKAGELFGFSLTGAAYTVDPQIKEAFDAEGIVEFDHLCSLAGSQVPEKVCQQMAKLFKLGKTYVLALHDHNGPIADLVFICGQKQELENRVEVETLGSMLSLCLQRVYSEQDSVLKLLSICGNEEQAKQPAYDSLLQATDRMPDIIYHLDRDGRIEFINQAVQRYGYERQGLIGRHILDIVHPADREKAKWKLAERRTGSRRTRKFEVRLQTGNNHTVFFRLYNRSLPREPVLLIDAEGLYSGRTGESEFMGTLGVGHDITEQKMLQDELDQHSYMFRTIIENIGEAAWLEEIDPQRTLYLNPACERLFQVSAEGLQKNPELWLQRVHPDDRAGVEGFLEKLNSEQEMGAVEYRLFDGEGGERWIRSELFPVRDPYGILNKTVGIARDITVEQHEKQLLQQKVEREKAFVREINHRVKNNLMMLDSMLNLELASLQEQSERSAGQEQSEPRQAAEILSKVKGRIRAVGLVHEMLYSSSQDKAVEAGSYLQELGESLLEADGAKREKVVLIFEVDNALWLPVKMVIPLGMIFSELLTNALKYAFPGDGRGHVRVQLASTGQAQYELRVCDDGVDLPADYDQKSRSIGHSLISGLSRQLNGEFEIEAGGTKEKCFKIRFVLD